MTAASFDKNVIYGLYCLCHPGDGIRYVGQTSHGINARLAGHLSAAKHVRDKGKRLHHSQRWILAHGSENIAVAVLEVCLPDELDAAEERWISLFDNLTNHKPGGNASRGWRMPPDRVEEMRGAGNPMYGKRRPRHVIEAMHSAPRRRLTESERQAKRDLLASRRLDDSAEATRIEGIRRSHGTQEYRAAARERVAGEKNPMYGRKYTDKELAARSEMVSSKLSNESVADLKRKVRSGVPQKDVAMEYGVAPSTVSHIMARRRWSWVD